MKKLEDVIVSIDERVDKSFGHLFAKIAKHFSVFSSLVLIVLLGLFLFKVVYHRAYYLSSVIEQDIVRIAKILGDVDKNCTVLSVQGERVPINFLTVKSFVGSNVGGLNLAYPQRWQGPYLEVNPTHQQRFYDIVQTSEGFFVVPGEGVQLPNGFIMGKDIHIGYDTSVKKLLSQGGGLHYQGSVFGLQLSFKTGVWDAKVGAKRSTIDKLNFFISEFNQAMPFTKNTAPSNQVVAS